MTPPTIAPVGAGDEVELFWVDEAAVGNRTILALELVMAWPAESVVVTITMTTASTPTTSIQSISSEGSKHIHWLEVEAIDVELGIEMIVGKVVILDVIEVGLVVDSVLFTETAKKVLISITGSISPHLMMRWNQEFKNWKRWVLGCDRKRELTGKWGSRKGRRRYDCGRIGGGRYVFRLLNHVKSRSLSFSSSIIPSVIATGHYSSQNAGDCIRYKLSFPLYSHLENKNLTVNKQNSEGKGRVVVQAATWFTGISGISVSKSKAPRRAWKRVVASQGVASENWKPNRRTPLLRFNI
jgi:hypothetical protein